MNSIPNKAVEPPRKGEFEKSLTRLEEVVKRLESTDLSLDEAMKLFEEGVKLSRVSQQRLDAAEKRVEQLLADDEQGRPRTAPFATDASEDEGQPGEGTPF